MVTAELSVATLAVCALLVMLCWCIYLVVMQLRCIDTAAEVARQAARHDSAAVRRATLDAPSGARVSVSSSERAVRVTVRLDARPLTNWLLTVPLEAAAEAVPEPQGDR